MAAVRVGLRPADIKNVGGSEFFSSHVNTVDTETLDQNLAMLNCSFSGLKRQIYHYPDAQLSPHFFEGPNATGGWRFAATILA